jgi:hypothetical protein
VIALLLGAAILQKDGGARFPTAQPRSTAQFAHLYAALPLSFEANRGQTDPSVNFLARGQGYALFLTGREAVLTLKNPASSAGAKEPPASTAPLRLHLLGANAQAVAAGTDELPGKANYFIGNDPSQWHTNVPTYAKVRYESVYPGVDLVYYGTQGGQLEYDFVVAPGADPQAIALGVETQGKGSLWINSEGDLVLPLPSGDVKLHKPVVYQPATNNGRRTADHGQGTSIEGHYLLDAQNRVRFEVGPYDHSRPLVIDPVLVYATYLGGSGGDVGYAIAIDAVNSSTIYACIAGVTNSSNLPTTAAPGSPYQGTYGGLGDAFVSEINAAGTALVFSTYLGGSGTDTATAIAISNGSPFITGYTSSTNFPVKAPAGIGTPEPFQQTYGGNTDAFVAELSTDGSTLIYSSYLGGSGADFGQGIAVDSSGNAYVTGSTQSSNFPIIAGAMQPSLNGPQNAFVTKVNSTGEALLYSTYLGGSRADVSQAIRIDSSGNAYIAGYTYSSDFLIRNPPSATPIQSTIGGGADAFVSKLNSTGSALTFSTFLGGSSDDSAYGIALDSSLNVYVAGTTSSTNFPTSGPFQPSLKGASNAFVTKLNAAGTSILYSTYLGGSGTDYGNAIAVTPAGIAFVTGSTNSSDFPTQNPIQAVLGLSNNNYCQGVPCADAFVTQFNTAGNGLTYSTYLGGSSYDSGQAIALDSTGDPYITGSTTSTNFPAISPYNSAAYTPPYKSTLTGLAGNAFIAKIDPANNPNISIVPQTVNFGNETISVTSALQQVNIVNPSTVPLIITSIVANEVFNSVTIYTETDECVGTLPAGESCPIYVAFTPSQTGNITDTITITDNAGGVAGTTQTIALTGAGVTAATSVTIQPTSLSFASQDVGTTSPPQTVTITNTGTQTLNITKFSVGSSLDYSITSTQSNGTTSSCTALANTLAISQSCAVYVYFSPTATGTRNATLSISDTATGSPQTVALTGIGAASFTLTNPASSFCSSNCNSSQTVNPVVIGATQTTFVIVANETNGVNTGTIALACSAGTTCSFNPANISASGGAGSTSVLTVSNLSPQPASNPYAFTVTGTSGSQTASLPLNLFFEDYTLTASPSSVTIPAGATAGYTILVNPLSGFNQAVDLAIYSGQPPASTPTFSPVNPTPNGTSPAQSKFSLGTAVYVPVTVHAPPRFPGGKLPPTVFGLLCLGALASLAFGNRRRARHGRFGTAWMWVRLATISLILTLNLALVGCRSSTLSVSGTTTGNYTITISGTMASNTAVVRFVTVDLSVTTSP